MDPIFTYKTLAAIPQSQILKTMNLAFSDYPVPIQYTMAHFSKKLFLEDIDLSISIGAFDQGQMVGLILHGARKKANKKLFYNAGTGVIPKSRGRQLTAKMFHSILPLLKTKNYTNGVLEVLDSNTSAIKIYQSLGYKINRTLYCYKGEIKALTKSSDIEIKLNCGSEIDSQHFWDWQPTWQNVVTQKDELLQQITATLNKELIGYCVFNSSTAKIMQFAVDPNFRNKGIGRKLLFTAQKVLKNKTISLLNIDGTNIATQKFLSQLGLDHFLTQNEMTLEL